MSDNNPAKVHPNALVDQGVTLGPGTRVWAFAHIMSGAKIGADCNICDHTYIEGKVTMGNRVTVKSGVYLWDGLDIADDVFLGPNAVFTNDMRPRSKVFFAEYLPTSLGQGCTIGANSTILPNLKIGKYAMIGAGAVVTKDVPDYGLVKGNPARLVGWVCRCGQTLPKSDEPECQCGKAYSFVENGKLQERQVAHA